MRDVGLPNSGGGAGLPCDCALFADLDAGERAAVTAFAVRQRHPQGTQVYNVGDSAVDVYILVSGVVRFTVGFGQRETSAGELLRQGEVFGWAALVPTMQHRVATAMCVSDCVVLAINGRELRSLMDAQPRIGYRVMTRLTAIVTGQLTAYASG